MLDDCFVADAFVMLILFFMFIAHLHLHVYSALQHMLARYIVLSAQGKIISASSLMTFAVVEKQGYLGVRFMLFRLFQRVPFDPTLLSFRLFCFRRCIFGCFIGLILRGLDVINVHRQVLRPGLLRPCAIRHERMFEHVLGIRWTGRILVNDGLVLRGRPRRNNDVPRCLFRRCWWCV